MVDEIITALSRFRSLFVIARNSTFTYKGRSVDVKQAGRELGVRYVLKGGVRKAANRVRIIGQLIDTTTGAHIWADRFEGGLEDAFDLQAGSRRAWWERSRRSWSWPRSSAPNASRPRVSTRTTTTCVGWRVLVTGRRRLTARRSRCSIRPLGWTRISLRPTAWRRGATLSARGSAG